MQVFKFQDEIHHYQSFVRSNIKMLGNLVILSEQLLLRTRSRNYIDILAYDLDANRLVILELKNVISNDSIIGQSIRYYDSMVKANPDSLYELLKQQGIENEEVNLKPKIILVAPEFNDHLLHSIKYIDGIDISIVKLNLLYNNNYHEIVKEYFKPIEQDVVLDVKQFKQWNFEEYRKENINSDKIALAKQFINYVSNRLQNKAKLNVYFYDKKIVLEVNKRNWASILIRQQPNNNYLDVSLVNKDNQIDTSVLPYEGDILKYKVLINDVKITCLRVPIRFLSKII